MKFKADDITSSLIRQRLRVYNNRVNRLQKLGQGYQLLETIGYSDFIKGKTEAEIARELNQLEKLGEKKNQKLVQYSRGSKVYVPLFFRDQVERALRAANKNTKKVYEKIMPSKEAGTLSTITSENLRPLTKGSGADIKSISKRLASITRRADPQYLEKTAESYKWRYINAVQHYLGPYGDIIEERIRLLDSDTFISFLSDPVYGADLEISFIYSEAGALVKAETINNALDYFLEGR